MRGKKQTALNAELDFREFPRILTTDDLEKNDNVFFTASGITYEGLFRGVQ